MTAASRGQKLARKKPRATSVSHRKHRFEPFSQRIAKIKIDPVRQIRRHDIQDEELSSTASYFRTALDQYAELNLSENFAEFSQEVLPLSESLPQLIHFQDSILELLVKYIEKRDALSLEHLLLLIGHFAHDLGVAFERHYPKVVALVSSVASTHQDVEVIEWSFTCLAWMFKYLARLLVPDIRPTYDLLAPLLGKESQKSFVSKFAAEGLSFLVRKAGIIYPKNRVPLQSIVQHIFDDLRNFQDDSNIEAFTQAIMTLFSEAMKGINQEIHLCGSSILRCLLQHTEDNSSAEDICNGILTNCIHHSNKETFSTVLEVILDYAETSKVAQDAEPDTRRAMRLLYVVTGVRKGTRVSNWNRLMDAVCSLLLIANSIGSASTVDFQILATVGVAVQYCPLDILTPRWRTISEELLKKTAVSQFLPFCNFFATLGEERFRLLLYPVLMKYVSPDIQRLANTDIFKVHF
jgi:U3 small nucleolar RNA-associated protein 20